MCTQVHWNSIILDEFLRLALLTEDEETVIKTRIAGWSITQQSIKLGMSECTINRIIARLKLKYDSVQPYSDILPPRDKNVNGHLKF